MHIALCRTFYRHNFICGGKMSNNRSSPVPDFLRVFFLFLLVRRHYKMKLFLPLFKNNKLLSKHNLYVKKKCSKFIVIKCDQISTNGATRFLVLVILIMLFSGLVEGTKTLSCGSSVPNALCGRALKPAVTRKQPTVASASL